MADRTASPLPPVDGVLELAGLEAPVTIVRDRWGVPHIRAAGAGDAFFAVGYVHAQDRLWQMDAARRRAVGRYAEWAGPTAVATDVLSRRLDIEGASRRDTAALNTETGIMLERYAAGVNAFIAGGILPVEYTLLETEPELWEPWQSVAVMRQRGLLMGSVWFKLWRAAALRTVGPEAVSKLRYDDGGPDGFVVPQGETGRRWIASLQDLGPALQALAAMAGPDATDGGSNNWALAGRHTASGRPLVAGDPHRAFEIPNMYTQLHVACDDFDALGLTVPGVPGFPHFGHNGRVAWCVTHAFADIHDLYVERFDPAVPSRYLYKDEWHEATLREETVAVRGSAPVTVMVTTTRHGPVIVGDPASGHAVALRSVQIDDTDTSLDCLIPMMKAPAIAEFYAATRAWGLIDHNLVAADVDDRIGVLVRAVVPDRDRLNGWLPVPGWTGEHEWRGMIPWERMPREIDPPAGLVVTANNRIVPDDHPDYLCTDCHPTYRADRVRARLEALSAATVDDMASIHRDTLSRTALELRAWMVAAQTDGEAERWRRLLEAWDGRMDAAALAPTAYFLIRREMTRILARRSGLDKTASDPFAQVAPGIPALIQLWWTLPNLLRANDTSLLGGADWSGLVQEAMTTASARDALAPWGELHRPRFAHPLSPMFPDAAGDLDPISEPVSGDGDCVCANGAYANGGVAASYGPVARYAFDVGDWDNSRWVVFHGTSGHPASAHYDDQNRSWAKGEMVPAPYTAAAVDTYAATRLVLNPVA